MTMNRTMRAALTGAAGLAIAALACAQAPAGGAGAPSTPAATGAPPAMNDGGFLAKVNAIYQGRDRAVPDAQRAELVLLPKLAEMDKAPAWLRPLSAALLTPRSKGWAEADAWAGAEKQRAALDALKAVTEQGKRFAFNQGYGRDAADPAVRASGLFTDVGEPAVLAAARFNYLPALDRLGALAMLEATRLGEAKKGKEAADLMVRWIVLGRLIADREFAAEKAWGGHAMLVGLERLRDIVHTYGADMTDADIKGAVDGLDTKLLSMERVVMPQGDRLAAEQLVALGYVERAGPKAETFGAMMARVSSTGRPLAQFGEAARWQESSPTLASTYETMDAIKAAFNDWSHRWSLTHFDPLQERPTDYSRLDKARYATVEAAMGRIPGLFSLRQRLFTELVGTRQSLAVAAFQRKNAKWPPALAAARPVYVKEIEPDPFDPKKGEMHFFVPIRDQPRGERDLPKPHVVRVGLRELTVTDQDRAINEQVEKFLDTMLVESKTILTTMSTSVASSRDEAAAARQLMEQLKGFMAKLKEFEQSLDPALRERTLEILSLKAQAVERATQQNGATLAKEIAEGKLMGKDAPARIDAVIEEQRKALKSAGASGSFAASLDDTGFVLYSVGSNHSRDWARNVGQDGADILLWPPVLSLARDMLAKQGTEAMAFGADWLDYEPANLPPPPPPVKTAKPGESQAPQQSAPSRGPGRPSVPGG